MKRILLVCTLILAAAFAQFGIIDVNALTSVDENIDVVYRGTLTDFLNEGIKTEQLVDVTVEYPQIKDGETISFVKIDANDDSQSETNNEEAYVDDQTVSVIDSSETKIEAQDVDLSNIEIQASSGVDYNDVSVNITTEATGVSVNYKVETDGDSEEQYVAGEKLTYYFTFINNGENNTISVNFNIDSAEEVLVENSVYLGVNQLEYQYNDDILHVEFPMSGEPVTLVFQTEVVADDIVSETDMEVKYENTFDGQEHELSAKKENSKSLPADLGVYDKSDAPNDGSKYQYGEIKQRIAIRKELTPIPGYDVYVGNQYWAQTYHEGVYLGYDAPDPEMDSDKTASVSANLDDEHGERGDEIISGLNPVGPDSGWDTYTYADDETGFVGKRQRGSDNAIAINPYEKNLHFEIPYMFSEEVSKFGTSGTNVVVSEPNPIDQIQLLVWIDFDVDGKFDEDEGVQIGADEFEKYTMDKSLESGFASHYKKVNVDFDLSKIDIDRAKIISDGTYMRAVLTSDMTYGLKDAQKSPADSSVGEIEDYRIVGVANTETCGYNLVNNPIMNPKEVEYDSSNPQTITYKGISNIYTSEVGDELDVTVNIYGSNSFIFASSEAGQGIQTTLYAVGIVPDDKNTWPSFDIEFTDSKTGEPVSVPVTIELNDLDRFEYVRFNQEFDSVALEEDALYGPKDGSPTTISYIEPYYLEAMTEITYGDNGSAQLATVTFNSNSKISGEFNVGTKSDTTGVPPVMDGGMSLDSGIEFSINFISDEVSNPCGTDTYEFTKESDVDTGADATTDFGDTIHYTETFAIDAESILIQGGITISDELQADLEYIDGSGKLTYIDSAGDTSDVTSDATITYDAATKLITVEYPDNISGGSNLVFEFDALIIDEGVYGPSGTINNVADFVYTDADGKEQTLTSNETSDVAPTEANPIEPLTKEVITPSDGIIKDPTVDNEVEYKISVGPLTESSSSIVIQDLFESDGLSYKLINSIELESAGSTSDISDICMPLNTGSSLLVVCNGDFKPGDVISVDFNAILRANTLDADGKAQLVNIGRGYSDGIATDTDNAYIGTKGPIVDSKVAVNKSVVGESGSRDGILEYGENVIYEITIENTGNKTLNKMTLIDDLEAQNLDQVYDVKKSRTISATVANGDGTVNVIGASAPYNIGDLMAGVTINGFDPGEVITIAFDLDAYSSADMPDFIDLDGDGKYDEQITNIATVTTNEGLGKEINVSANLVSPEKPHTKEKLTKQLSRPMFGNINAGDDVSYDITVEISEPATKVNIKDNFISPYLIYDGIEYVKLNDKDISYTENSRSQLDIDISGGFVAGDKIVVRTNAHISPSVPTDKDVSIANIAHGVVDGTNTNNATETITIGSRDEDTALYAEKRLANESGDINGQLEPEEEITYEIYIENTSSVDKAGVVIQDDLLALGLDEYFDLSSVDTDPLVIDGASSISPEPAYISNLMDATGVAVTVPAESAVTVDFTLTALTEEELPANSGTDAPIYNIATITDPDITTPINPIVPIDPPIIAEKNPKEKLTKEVVSPKDGIITSDYSAEYQITVGPLLEDAHSVVITDKLQDKLTLDAIKSVNVVDSSGTSKDISASVIDESTETKVMLLINEELNKGDSVVVNFTVSVSPEIGDEEDIANVAIARVDTILTNSDVAYISGPDGDGTDIDSDLAVSKDIVSESGSTDGRLEYGEDIEYVISVKNTGESTIDDIKVTDNFVDQGLDQVFVNNATDELTIEVSSDYDSDGLVTITPPNATIGDLNSGIYIDGLDSGETVEIYFTLTVKDEGDIADLSGVDAVVNKIEVEDPTTTDPITPEKPILPPLEPDEHTRETLIKTASKEQVEPGEVFQYTFTMKLEESAKNIRIVDDFNNAMLEYRGINSVTVNGSDYTDYKLNSADKLDITLVNLSKFKAGDEIAVTIDAYMASDAPDGMYFNYANANVDGTDTTTDVCVVKVGDDTPDPEETSLYAEKRIKKESLNSNNTIEAEEKITYEIILTNTLEESDDVDNSVTVTVSDNLVDQGFDEYFDLSKPRLIPISVKSIGGDVTVKPEPITVADLIDDKAPIELTIDPKTEVHLQFTLTTKSASELPSNADMTKLITNTLTVVDNEGNTFLPTASIHAPLVAEKNPQEVLTKEVNKTKVNPTEKVEYTITTEFSEHAGDVTIIDALDNDKLKFIDVTEVNLISGGSSTPVAESQWKNTSTTNLNLVIKDLNAMPGDSLEVVFEAKVKYDAIVGSTIDNKAIAYVDGTATNNDVASIAVGKSILLPKDSQIYTEKNIIDETGAASGIVDPEESVTYEIFVENISQEPVTVTIKDELAENPYADIFVKKDSNLTVLTSGSVSPIPSGKLSDLASGITTTLEPEATVKIQFTLTAKTFDEFPLTVDADGDGKTDPYIENIAQVKEEGKRPLYPATQILMPELPKLLASPVLNKNGELSTGIWGPYNTVNYRLSIENYNFTEINVNLIDDLEHQDHTEDGRTFTDISYLSKNNIDGNTIKPLYMVLPGQEVTVVDSDGGSTKYLLSDLVGDGDMSTETPGINVRVPKAEPGGATGTVEMEFELSIVSVPDYNNNGISAAMIQNVASIQDFQGYNFDAYHELPTEIEGGA